MVTTASVSGERSISSLVLVAWIIAGIVFVWSAIRPHDYFTWVLEVFPGIVAAVILIAIYRKFPLTNLLYVLIAIHVCVLFVGGHYTYAEVPLFNWMRDHFHQARNNYDKVGHFMQGFVPAIVAREVLIRRKVVERRGWLPFVVLCICLAISAAYELFEWAVAVMSGSSAEAFLGTQGDPWDTQKDMFTAVIGASTALLTLSRVHDNQVAEVEAR